MRTFAQIKSGKMKLHNQNLGPIKEATIDLSKRFYTFVGYNNSGKTYLANLLAAIFSEANMEFAIYLLKKYPIKRFENDFVLSQELLNKIPFEYALYLKNIILPRTLNINANSLIIRDLIINISVDTSIENLVNFIPSEDIVHHNADYLVINGGKKKDSYILLILVVLSQKIFQQHGKSIDFLPTERLSFMTFYKYFFRIEQERREEIAEYIHQINTENPNWEELKEISESAYLNVHKNLIEMIERTNISEIDNKNAYFKQEQTDLIKKLAEMMQGHINVVAGLTNEDANFRFQMSKNKEELKFHTTSSSINQLSPLYLYWKYWAANAKNFLIIDEPEQNLHPENQIKLTELLIQFANRNENRVLIATHSPLITEVINNYLILGQLDNKEEEQKRLGLAENCFLTPENTGIYFFTGKQKGSSNILAQQLSFRRNLFHKVYPNFC
jgi:energy-coupling factor transporter ATP-binding protein EcfA2